MRFDEFMMILVVGMLVMFMFVIVGDSYSQDVRYREQACDRALDISHKLGYGNQTICEDIILPMRQIDVCEIEDGERTNCIRFEYGLDGTELVVGRYVDNF